MTASEADQPNIRPKPHHLPLRPAAWVLFAQGHFISDLDLRQHAGIITLA